MTTKEFVEAFYKEKQKLLDIYLSSDTETQVGQLIKSLNLNAQQVEVMKNVLNSSFTDIFYTILLGLDGCASIGGVQVLYDLKDEYGNQLSGEIESYAYEFFHESQSN